MTHDQAIKIIECLGWGYPDNEIKEAVHMAADALRNQDEADKYLTPKKVVKIGMEVYECPNCGLVLDCAKYPVSYCGICGQAIDWSEMEEPDDYEIDLSLEMSDEQALSW